MPTARNSKDAMNKPKTNFTLTQEAKDLLRQMAQAQGISMTAVLETLIRQAAQKEASR